MYLKLLCDHLHESLNSQVSECFSRTVHLLILPNPSPTDLRTARYPSKGIGNIRAKTPISLKASGTIIIKNNLQGQDVNSLNWRQLFKSWINITLQTTENLIFWFPWQLHAVKHHGCLLTFICKCNTSMCVLHKGAGSEYYCQILTNPE